MRDPLTYIIPAGLAFLLGGIAGQICTERRLSPKREIHTYEVVTEYYSVSYKDFRISTDTIQAPEISGLILGQYVHSIDSSFIGEPMLLAEYAESGYNYYPDTWNVGDLVPLSAGITRLISFRRLP